MKQKIKNYLTIIHLELEDLDEDIQFLINEVHKKKEHGGLTNYVFLENQALLKNEIRALECFRKIIKKTSPEDFRSVDELIEYLREEFRIVVDANSYAEAILIFTDRKMQKVKNYINS
ncbi:MAG: hypothetical protein JXQ65_10120 [Candidatus Marinimicrobia bacterium]|nr:hypothetical protein [Candidatus Neomarinimicrobiota bacterium]